MKCTVNTYVLEDAAAVLGCSRGPGRSGVHVTLPSSEPSIDISSGVGDGVLRETPVGTKMLPAEPGSRAPAPRGPVRGNTAAGIGDACPSVLERF